MIWKKAEADEPETPIQTHQAPQPASPPHNPPQPSRERAMIGPSIEIQGTLTGGEDLFIEGKIDGKIELRQHGVTIGKSGRVHADVEGRTIVVMGEVEGDLCGEEQIILRQSSTVRGNLFAPRITLEDGARFKGSIDMNPQSAAENGKAPRPPLKAPAALPQRQEKTAEKS
jgi:cytoskeletal protein CcmA (bactofilin family)